MSTLARERAVADGPASRSTTGPGGGAPGRGSLGAALALPAVAALTTWWAMLSWSGFTTRSSEFLVPLAGVVMVLAVTGAVLRWTRSPGVLVVATQAVVAAALTSLVLTGQPVPGPALLEAVRRAAVASTQYAAPVPATEESSIRALLLVGGVVAALLVDLLACSLRRVPLAGLPLLVVYSVPVSILGDGPAWWVFAGSAAGFLLLLYLQEERQVHRWGRPLDEDPLSSAPPDTRRRTAVSVGVLATIAALLVPLAVPTLGGSLLDLGAGDGDGSDIEIDNPTVDLRRNLTQDVDTPLVQVRTDDPDPSYLRISVLNRFSESTWSSGDRAVPTDQVADGALPPLEGVAADVDRTASTYDVSIEDDFATRWLPTQAPVSAVDADGDWRYDATTMDFIAGDDELTAAGLEYSMTAVDLDYDPAALDTAAESYPNLSRELLAVPDDLPPVVSALADEVTNGADSAYEQATALQQWFRRDGGFTYSLESVPSRVGTSELEAFLDDRVGYCQQFAASMAVMARTLGIPARVAVGFLRPDELSPGTYEYSAFDLHSWPELYFPGSGWVRFDPTPASRVGGVPAYSRGQDPRGDRPSARPSAEPSAAPSARPSDAPRSAAPTTAPDQLDDAAGDGSDGSGLPWATMLTLLVVLLALTAAARLPRALRERQRARRLDAGGPEDAWRELWATTLDLGLAWPEDRSPRETRTAVQAHFAQPDLSDATGAAGAAGPVGAAGAGGRAGGGGPARPSRGPGRNPEADAALDRIVDALERSRYARAGVPGAGGEPLDLSAEVETCRAALVAGAGPRARRRATWLPASLLGRRQPSPAGERDLTLRR